MNQPRSRPKAESGGGQRPSGADQRRRFEEAARELGCDESEERFGELVKKLARAGPQHKPSKGKKPER